MTSPRIRTCALAAVLGAGMALAGGAAFADPDHGARGGAAPYGMTGPGHGGGPGHHVGPGYGMGPGMMGPGYGMMGPGYRGGPGRHMGPGYGMAPGMMGPGMMGPGMMGPGMMGPGMMAPGYGMRPGMTGPGYGRGYGHGCDYGDRQPLDVDDVRALMERRLAYIGNPRLELGKVEAEGDTSVIVEIVTAEGGALVDRLAVDRYSGRTVRQR